MTPLEQRLRLRLHVCECNADGEHTSRWQKHDEMCTYRLLLEAADEIAALRYDLSNGQ